ncbi:MAG: tRNA (adenosine(37)-N6)-threonylcarbamoyltransferase complex dimerization subunit type 1 TsaB [Pirellulales bacterium]
MNILAIDTSLSTGSVAAMLHRENGVHVTEKPLGEARGHARRLVQTLTTAAESIGFHVRDADIVAVVNGPGSFTGLRVGVTTAKALCWASAAKLIGVSGFDIVARRTSKMCSGHTTINIAFDAGRDEVYATEARANENALSGWCLTGGKLFAREQWLESLPPGRCVSGPAMESCAIEAASRGLTVAPSDVWHPSASDVATLGHILSIVKISDAPADLLPEYSRPSYAEEKHPRSSG